jgi:hypothetical protein
MFRSALIQRGKPALSWISTVAALAVSFKASPTENRISP